MLLLLASLAIAYQGKAMAQGLPVPLFEETTLSGPTGGVFVG